MESRSIGVRDRAYFPRITVGKMLPVTRRGKKGPSGRRLRGRKSLCPTFPDATACASYPGAAVALHVRRLRISFRGFTLCGQETHGTLGR
jgi:hypothetical protein